MIDTVKIAIPLNEVIFSNFQNYTYSPEYMQKVLSGQEQVHTKFTPKRENTIQETKKYGYLPQVSISKYANQIGFCVIRFSAPTIIYGNNLYETKEQDFPILINQIHSKLQLLGITVPTDSIKDAAVWEIHTCKNIDLTSYSTIHTVISTLSKLYFGKKLNKGETIYFNDEVKYQTYDGIKFNLLCDQSKNKTSNSYEICFYDKIEEVSKTASGRQFLIKNKNLLNNNNILRFEYRLYTAKITKAKLSQSGLNPDISFDNLFKQQTIQHLNSNMWESIMDNPLKLLNHINRRKTNLWDSVYKLNPKSPMKSIYDYALYNTFAKTGFKNIPKNILEKNVNLIPRLNKKLDSIKTNIKYKTKIQKTMSYIKEQILYGRSFI